MLQKGQDGKQQQSNRKGKQNHKGCCQQFGNQQSTSGDWHTVYELICPTLKIMANLIRHQYANNKQQQQHGILLNYLHKKV